MMTTQYPTPFKNIAILGLGRSGMAVLKRARQLGIGVDIFDDKAPSGPLPHAVSKPEDWKWERLDAVVISPGIAHHHPWPHPLADKARKYEIEIISEVEFALRISRPRRWISITGTNGKSTTTALVGHILKSADIDCAIGGNIGEAVTGLPEIDVSGLYVIELSSYQLEITPSLTSDVGVILNISPDHLDRHGGMDGYIRAKEQVLKSVQPGGLAILGSGDALDKMAKDYQDTRHIIRLDTPSLSAEYKRGIQAINPALFGQHNSQNCLAARLICRKFGLDDRQIDCAMQSFPGLAHRLQPAGQFEQILYVNDSKATNAEAAARALASYRNIHWCAGGIAKSDGIEACLPYLSHVSHSYLYGRAAEEFAQTLRPRLPVSRYETLEQAVSAASQTAFAAMAQSENKDDKQVILLSPAAASFDQFASFEARGELFCKLAAKEISKMAGFTASPTKTQVNHV